MIMQPNFALTCQIAAAMWYNRRMGILRLCNQVGTTQHLDGGGQYDINIRK